MTLLSELRHFQQINYLSCGTGVLARSISAAERANERSGYVKCLLSTHFEAVIKQSVSTFACR
ncbi:hypothetical protein [Scytonema sp. NUACC26]|uniref:hypothetical protein n=1 Tax=Scytonema sp. NUACC26 TaxID=3140176 RepID=UPI0038B2952A